jgi:DNA-binding beta-propeller fold protein YncE
MKKIRTIFLLFIATVIGGCAEKFDITQFETESGKGNIKGDTLYVQLSPEWGGFNKPSAMLVGNEPFLYVADTDNNRIVMLNMAGQILGFKDGIKKPVAIAQDYQLNLIVCAEFDTLSKTFSAIYKIDMVAGLHNIAAAPVKRILPRPGNSSDLKEQIRYTGVAVFYDNSFYVSRTGPNNLSFVDPDNSILFFQKKQRIDGTKVDTLIGRLPSLEPTGSGLMTAYQISSLTSFKRKNNDFIMTLTGGTSFKVQWLYFNYNSESPGYENKLSASFADIMKVNRFLKPEGCTMDNAGNIFVADAAKDSVYKFNSFGDELQSFGGPNVFNAPSAVAHFDQTLYVLDKGNNRILRFILSTDIR